MKLTLSFALLLLFVVSGFSQINQLKGEWSLISLKEKGKDISPIAGKPKVKPISIRFLANGAYSVQSACNSISGKYAAPGKGRLKFTKSIITAMFCSNESNNIDVILGSVLSKITKYQRKNKTLILQDKSGLNVLVFDGFK